MKHLIAVNESCKIIFFINKIITFMYSIVYSTIFLGKNVKKYSTKIYNNDDLIYV